MKLANIVGARPQFIKAAAFSAVVRKYNQNAGTQLVQDCLIHSGQHYDADMSDLFFRQLELPDPYCHLGVSGVSGHGAMTGRMLERLEKVLQDLRPDMVLVYGDTNTTLSAALAAAKLGLPVAHAESGLRSNDRTMPEEINRIVTDHIASLLFCPTTKAMENLASEGLTASRSAARGAYQVGDLMLDSALRFAHLGNSAMHRLEVEIQGKFALCTAHREVNVETPQRLAGIMDAVSLVSHEMPVVFPLHPRTAMAIDRFGLAPDRRVRLTGPVGYFEMLELLRCCSIVLTDSGGLQKEAYFLAKPCVTLREETEWTETVESGCNVLAGTNPEAIVNAVARLLSSDLDFSGKHYGDGNAAGRMLEIILNATDAAASPRNAKTCAA